MHNLGKGVKVELSHGTQSFESNHSNETLIDIGSRMLNGIHDKKACIYVFDNTPPHYFESKVEGAFI